MFYHCSSLDYLDLSSFSGSSVTNMNYMFSSCDLVFLNMKQFIINNYETLSPKNTFNGAPTLQYFCLEDTTTYNYFSTDKVLRNKTSDCSYQCFQNNYKISSYDCSESCSNYIYNNICKTQCPTNTYNLKNSICSDILPENYYLDSNDNVYKECYERCKKCNNFGNETINNCDECKNNYTFINDSLLKEKNCYEKCENYYYINAMKNYFCVNICPDEYNKLINPKNKCIDDCQNDNIYIYEYNNTCLEECPNYTKTDIEEKKCYISCHDYKFEYNNTCLSDCPENTYRIFISRNICVESIPENFYLDYTDNIYKECYYTCKKCNQSGTESSNKCNECINNYTFINESFIDPTNCYRMCDYYFYFDENNKHNCTESNICPQKYNKLVIPKKKCIDECINDEQYIYEFNKECLKQCPENIKIDVEEKKCKLSCENEQIEFDNKCFNDFPNETIKLSKNMNILINQNDINVTNLINNIILSNYEPEEGNDVILSSRLKASFSVSFGE